METLDEFLRNEREKVVSQREKAIAKIDERLERKYQRINEKGARIIVSDLEKSSEELKMRSELQTLDPEKREKIKNAREIAEGGKTKLDEERRKILLNTLGITEQEYELFTDEKINPITVRSYIGQIKCGKSGTRCMAIILPTEGEDNGMLSDALNGYVFEPVAHGTVGVSQDIQFKKIGMDIDKINTHQIEYEPDMNAEGRFTIFKLELDTNNRTNYEILQKLIEQKFSQLRQPKGFEEAKIAHEIVPLEREIMSSLVDIIEQQTTQTKNTKKRERGKNSRRPFYHEGLELTLEEIKSETYRRLSEYEGRELRSKEVANILGLKTTSSANRIIKRINENGSDPITPEQLRSYLEERIPTPIGYKLKPSE